MRLSDRLRALAGIEPGRWVLEHRGQAHDWRRFMAAAEGGEALACVQGVPDGAGFAVVVRNHPASIVGLTAALLAGRAAIYLNGAAPEGKRAADLADLRPAVLVGQPEDFTPAVTA